MKKRMSFLALLLVAALSVGQLVMAYDSGYDGSELVYGEGGADLGDPENLPTEGDPDYLDDELAIPTDVMLESLIEPVDALVELEGIEALDVEIEALSGTDFSQVDFRIFGLSLKIFYDYNLDSWVANELAYVGGTGQLSIVGGWLTGYALTIQSVSWTSSNANVLSINATGPATASATAHRAGTTVITARVTFTAYNEATGERTEHYVYATFEGEVEVPWQVWTRDAPAPPEPPPSAEVTVTRAPQTGDGGNMIPFVIFAFSLGALSFLSVIKRKREGK